MEETPAAAATGPPPRTLADQVPDRNRVVDLFRAGALLVVVLGHWVMAGLYVDSTGSLHRTGLLGIAPWTHPFTWALQVIPVLMLVGGFVNALSWRKARARGTSYGAWLWSRARRLTAPLIPLMLYWLVALPLAPALGLGEDWVRVASKASLVPTWFLAMYLLIVALVPVTVLLWERLGWGSVVLGLLLAAGTDVLSISTGHQALGLPNTVFVWGTLHLLGYAWLDGSWGGPGTRVAVAASALSGLAVLVSLGPYGVSMVGVRGHGLDNTYPPRVTLLLLGISQSALLLFLEPVCRRLAAARRVWRATVVITTHTMTLYLWHLTVFGAVAGISALFSGIGLQALPNSTTWWWSRPAWFVGLALVTAVVVTALGTFERGAPRSSRPPPTLLSLACLVVVCAGLALLADRGLAGDDAWKPWVLVSVLSAALVLYLPWRRGTGRPPRIISAAADAR